MNKTIPLALAILLVVPLSFGISLQELINSYDFTTTSSEINVTSIRIDQNDTNADNIKEQLLINVEVQASKANYSFNADIKKDGKFITSSTNLYELDGQHTIAIPIDARLLSNGDYQATVTIQERFLTLYRKENAINFTFDNQNFTKPDIQVTVNGFELISNDADAASEILRINATANTNTTGIHEFRAFMKSSNISISKARNYTLNNDIINLEFDFNTSEIRKNRILNPNLYSIFVKNGLRYIFDTDLDITYNLSDLDPQQSLLEDVYQDGRKNNESAFLQINISVFALDTKTYNLTVELRDEENNFLVEETQAFALAAGERIIQFNLNGTDIYNTKTNGPYTVSKVIFANDEVANAHITKAYNYDDFQAPPLPDLTLNSAVISETGVTIEVENKGEKPAVGFTVKLFDENFTEVAENIITLQQPSSTISTVIDVNLTGQSSIFAIVDEDDEIEEQDESNNIFLIQEVNETVTIIIQLQKNWNLFSLPINVSNTTIKNIFQGKNISQIYTYNASIQDWELYTNETSNNFTNLKQERAYWINANENINLTVSGLNYSSLQYPIYNGWNLISFPSLATININTAVDPINTTFSKILSFQNQWLSYNNKRANLNTLTNLSASKGYWIKANQNTTWTFNGTFS